MKVLVTGLAGFIAGYLVQELLDQGHTVIGIDTYSKYGIVEKSYSASFPTRRWLMTGSIASRCDQQLQGLSPRLPHPYAH